LLGALASGTVAGAGRRAGSLSESGLWAAFAMGTVVIACGWVWGAVLVAYFVASSLVTRLGAARKAARTESVLPDSGGRSARQVAANGGVYTSLLVLSALTGDPRLPVAALGAIAAAAADTWATEIGTLWGGTPRMILTGRVMAPGASGGVTLAGTAASIGVAALVAVGAMWVVPSSAVAPTGAALAVLVGGIGGSIADSVLGATLQSKRWCEQCRTWTERRVHTCLYRTQHASGLRWMNNDMVNLLATVAGAALAFAMVAGALPR